MTDLLKFIFDNILSFWSGLRRVRFRTHRAFFIGSGVECFFLTVTNTSRSREIEITHVWLDTNPQVYVMVTERPLPKRLKPDEIWETWIPMQNIPKSSWDAAYHLGRLRLSNGKIIRSRKDKKVPSIGFVPGTN